MAHLVGLLPNLANLVDPPQKYLQKGKIWELGKQQSNNFEKWKQNLSNIHKMTSWPLKRETRLAANVSIFALKDLLEQKENILENIKLLHMQADHW